MNREKYDTQFKETFQELVVQGSKFCMTYKMIDCHDRTSNYKFNHVRRSYKMFNKYFNAYDWQYYIIEVVGCGTFGLRHFCLRFAIRI